MRSRTWTILAMGLSAVTWSVGCAADSSPDPGGEDAERAAAEASLREAAVAYQAAASAKDAATVVGFYADDALMVPPAGDLVHGIEGVRNYRFGFIETPGVELDFELVRVELSADGASGWTFAVGDITINRADGPPGRDEVRDFHTWRRMDDGSWRVVVDMWNSGVPAS